MSDIFEEAGAGGLKREATLSACGLYRYDLHRIWGNVEKTLPVVMVNPSTADASIDDPTIKDLMKRARSWGYGALVVTNLFAFRATDPSELGAAEDPIGPRNGAHLDFIIRRAVETGTPILAAWGANGRRLGRDAAFIASAQASGVKMICLGLTQDGFPKHPLARGKHRIPADFEPIPFAAPEPSSEAA